jgi:hypothetical protein
MKSFSDDRLYRVQQNNHGGAFVGRDNYGTISTIDETTKAMLAKLSHDAPALAELLRKAVQDGVVSPDLVHALEVAARNINTDVAEALWTAGRNINADVAETLLSASSDLHGLLSPGPGSLESVATRIEETLGRFETISSSLNIKANAYSLNAHDRQIGNRIRQPPSQSYGLTVSPRTTVVATGKRLLYSFVAGMIAGMALLAYIMHHH